MKQVSFSNRMRGGIALHFDPLLRDPCIRMRRWWGGHHGVEGPESEKCEGRFKAFERPSWSNTRFLHNEWMNVIICWFLWLCSVGLVMWGSQHVVQLSNCCWYEPGHFIHVFSTVAFSHSFDAGRQGRPCISCSCFGSTMRKMYWSARWDCMNCIHP